MLRGASLALFLGAVPGCTCGFLIADVDDGGIDGDADLDAQPHLDVFQDDNLIPSDGAFTTSHDASSRTAIFAEAFSTCAIADATLRCWGDNRTSELGIGPPDLDPHWIPTIVPGVAPSSVSIGGGNFDFLEMHVCGLASARAGCWGSNGYGELGESSSSSCGDPCGTVAFVPGLTDVDSISSGEENTCAVVGPDHRVVCWGAERSGSLGIAPGVDAGDPGCRSCANGCTTCSSIPLEISGLDDIAEVGLGTLFACARKRTDGSIWCWGVISLGTLGQPIGDAGRSQNGNPTPAQVPGIVGARQLAVGPFHVCVVLSDGGVSCWGLNSENIYPGNPTGQLGHDPFTDPGADAGTFVNPTPTRVAGLPAARELALGTVFTCAVTQDDSVWCWGENRGGPLGHDPALDADGGLVFSAVPTRVAGISDVAHVAAGASHACAVTRDDRVLCWGANGAGVLGVDPATTSSSFVPLRVEGL